MGLIGVMGGALVIGWVLLQHFERSPEGMRIGNPFEGPGYVITTGPYSFSRHPMHLAGMRIWFGWALFYGSVAVAIGAALLALVMITLVPSEERGIEAELGEEYRRYGAAFRAGSPSDPRNKPLQGRIELMKFGLFSIRLWGLRISRNRRACRAREAAGFDRLRTGERVVAPNPKVPPGRGYPQSSFDHQSGCP